MASSNYEYDLEWKKKLPIGFHFVPTDEELNMYLKLKSCGGKIPPGIFTDLDIYQYEPHELPGRAENHWDGRMYFFTSARKLYDIGERLGRKVHSRKGYWKASQARKKLSKNDNLDKQEDGIGDVLMGTKTPLVYHEYSESGEISKKTSWLMLEYRFPNKVHSQPSSNETKDKSELTLCVIYYHGTKKNNDDQIAILKECNADPIPLPAPINQKFDYDVAATATMQPNFPQLPQSYTDFATTQPIFPQLPQSYSDIATMQPSFPQLLQSYTDVATTSTTQPIFPQLPQSYSDIATMQPSFPQLLQSYSDIATMQPSFPQLPQSYSDIATMQPSFPQLPQSYSDIATMQPSFPQIPYGDFFPSIPQNNDFLELDQFISAYNDLDKFYYIGDEDIGHNPNSNVDSDQNKLGTCVAPISQDDQRPSCDSQAQDQQELKMKKIKI